MGCCRKKRARTEPKISLLMVGEGPTERIFLQHLKSLFWCKDCGHNVKIDNANGGDPSVIVHRANQLLTNMSYSKCAIILDTDRPWEEGNLLKAIRKNNPLTQTLAVGSVPCLEGLMLEMIEGKHPRTPDECKRQFRKKYILERHLRDRRKYATVFPREIIEEASKRIEGLDLILRFLKNEL